MLHAWSHWKLPGLMGQGQGLSTTRQPHARPPVALGIKVGLQGLTLPYVVSANNPEGKTGTCQLGSRRSSSPEGRCQLRGPVSSSLSSVLSEGRS